MPHDRKNRNGEPIAVAKAQFLAQCRPRFGTANPTRMDNEFWRLMVANGNPPQWARQHFGVTLWEAYPIWCFQRDGMSETVLPDGRSLFIGGRHEVYRDPDFHVYNDVILRQAERSVEIFGYAATGFPPTDFHTATLVAGALFLIGSLGLAYDKARLGGDPAWRPPDSAQVFKLDTATFEIARVTTHGEDPGWIANHDAEWLPAERAIYVADGQVIVFRDGKVRMEPTPGEFLFFPDSGLWSRVA